MGVSAVSRDSIKNPSFNTLAAPELVNRQFELFARLMDLDIDIYVNSRPM